jgi:hypothetical protein
METASVKAGHGERTCGGHTRWVCGMRGGCCLCMCVRRLLSLCDVGVFVAMVYVILVFFM